METYLLKIENKPYACWICAWHNDWAVTASIDEAMTFKTYEDAKKYAEDRGVYRYYNRLKVQIYKHSLYMVER